MKVRHPLMCLTALLICVLLAIPADVTAQAAQATEPQHAGKLTAVLPVVNVIRGPQQTPASTAEAIYWGDVINTGHLARARVALDDGSVLSVGSDSNLTVTKHDGGAQQTELDLNYGRVRAKAVKQVKPNASFQIRTPTGVAGVVGTDFALDSEGDTTRIVVYEGKVNFCAYKSKKKEEQEGAQGGAEAGAPGVSGGDQQNEKNRRMLGPCVIVGAGETSSVQFDAAPTPPVPATPVTVTDMTTTTSVGGAGGAAGGLGVAGATAVGVGAAVAVTVAAIVIRAASKTNTCSTPAAAAHVVPSSNCTAINNAGAGKVNGQRP
ncbi:MAG: FecR family protein [Candidatus Acidiferrales bacterium]